MDIDFRTIDIHTHILDGFDDGARTAEESSLLIRSAVSQGVEAVIATPHYSRRAANDNYMARQQDAIKNILRLCESGFRIYTGNETVWHEELPDRLSEGRGLALASGRYVLLEFSGTETWYTVIRAVRNLQNYGYTPVIAHMERYPCLREAGRVRELKGMHAMLQMNFDSLAGSIFDRDLKWCRRQVEEGMIDFLATDMHRLDFRPPDIGPAARWLQKRLDIRDIERMTYYNPLMIIESGSEAEQYNAEQYDTEQQ